MLTQIKRSTQHGHAFETGSKFMEHAHHIIYRKLWGVSFILPLLFMLSVLRFCWFVCVSFLFFSTVTLYYLSSIIENNDALRNKKETHTYTSHHWVSAQNVFDYCNMCTLYTVCGYFSNAQISWASFPTLFPTNRIYCVLCSHCVLYMLRMFLFKESVHS